MTVPKDCGHGRTFKQRCIECELVSAREGLQVARENVDKYSKLVVKLEAERELRDRVALTQSQR